MYAYMYVDISRYVKNTYATMWDSRIKLHSPVTAAEVSAWPDSAEKYRRGQKYRDGRDSRDREYRRENDFGK